MVLYFYMVLFNIDIVMLVLRQQQTMIYVGWCFVFYVSMLIEYRTQDNYAGIVTAWGTVLTSFLAVSLFDSITNIDIRFYCLISLYFWQISKILFFVAFFYTEWFTTNCWCPDALESAVCTKLQCFWTGLRFPNQTTSSFSATSTCQWQLWDHPLWTMALY